MIPLHRLNIRVKPDFSFATKCAHLPTHGIIFTSNLHRGRGYSILDSIEALSETMEASRTGKWQQRCLNPMHLAMYGFWSTGIDLGTYSVFFAPTTETSTWYPMMATSSVWVQFLNRRRINSCSRHSVGTESAHVPEVMKAGPRTDVEGKSRDRVRLHLYSKDCWVPNKVKLCQRAS